MLDPLIDQATKTEDVDKTDDIAVLVRELRSRQIELEIQNQELRQAQKKLADSRDRFWDLYDSAPVGYITLDREGIIREANLIAAELRASQLQESEPRFRGVLVAVPDAIISMDGQGLIMGTNQAAERIFGYLSNELIGESIRRLVPSFRYETSRNDRVFVCEPVARRKDGTALPIVMKTNEVKPQGLIVAIIQDVSSRKALEKQVVDATTDEQRRIGYDIHDGVGQELTGLRYMAQTHAESLAAQQSPDAQIAMRMSRWMETVQRQLRGIIKQLVPVEIDQKGLAAALHGLARDTCELHDVQCVFESELTTTVSDPARATQLFRIVQEAVNNAVRHSQADLIKILLDGTDDLLQLYVVDDGIGIDSLSKRRTGIGLSTMAYRAGLINADLRVERLDQGGTVVKCTVPQRTDFSF